MADFKEVFKTLEDANTDGVGISKRSQGDAVGTHNASIAFNAEDASNQVELLQIEAEGGDVPTKGQAVLPVKDENGDLQYIPMTDGAIVVSSEVPGTPLTVQDTSAAVKGTDVDGASLSLTASKVHDEIKVICSSFKPVLWKLVQIDDATTSTLLTFVTGPGQFHFESLLKNLQVTAGATGTQTLKITGNQLTGTGSNSDLHSYISVIEKP